jgi:hypothetical protein
MNEETPPPFPPSTPVPPPPVPPVAMAWRWILWVLVSTVLPAVPWMTYGGSRNYENDGIMILTMVALALQLAASIAVAVGFCRRRAIGVGGAIGMTIVFMIASAAIGTAIWFTSCLVVVSADNR